MMFRHAVKVLSLVTAITLGSAGFAHAHWWTGGHGEARGWGDNHGWDYRGWGDRRDPSDGRGEGNSGGDPSAPELNPAYLGSGLALLAGGILLLSERRRGFKS